MSIGERTTAPRRNTVDIRCGACGKPMMMLRFNYTTLERGFESISLRCQYCKTEETRPWPQEGVADVAPEYSVAAQVDAAGDDAQALGSDLAEPNEP